MMPKSMDQHISPQGGPGGWGAGGGMVMKLAAKCIDDCVAWEIGGEGQSKVTFKTNASTHSPQFEQTEYVYATCSKMHLLWCCLRRGEGHIAIVYHNRVGVHKGRDTMEWGAALEL